MFVDMSILVFEQGDKIDNIASNIEMTKDYVEESKIQTKEALDHSEAARRVRLTPLKFSSEILLIIR